MRKHCSPPEPEFLNQYVKNVVQFQASNGGNREIGAQIKVNLKNNHFTEIQEHRVELNNLNSDLESFKNIYSPVWLSPFFNQCNSLFLKHKKQNR